MLCFNRPCAVLMCWNVDVDSEGHYYSYFGAKSQCLHIRVSIRL